MASGVSFECQARTLLFFEFVFFEFKLDFMPTKKNNFFGSFGNKFTRNINDKVKKRNFFGVNFFGVNIKAILTFFVIVFLAILLALILPSTQADAKTRSKNSSSTPKNITNDLQIFARHDKTNLVIDYYFLQTFTSPSRGIFLALPLNQNGNWTNYTLKKAEKTLLAENTLVNKNFEDLNKIEFQPEKYEQISEWSEFRVRIGDKNKYLENKTYLYHLQIDTNLVENSHNFTFLRDWQDTVYSAKLSVNGKVVCEKLANGCDPKNKIEYNFFPNLTPPSTWQSFWFDWSPYLFILALISALTYYFWWHFSRDPDYGFQTNKPEFEPPKILPWQADFLVTDGAVNFKRTFLSYLLWLSNEKYIKILPQNPQEIRKKDKKIGEDKIKIEILETLPQVLPSQFNQTITEISQKGFSRGIYDSKINDSINEDLYKKIQDSLQGMYAQKGYSFNSLLVFAGILAFVGFIISVFIFDIFQNNFLWGNSYRALLTFTCICLTFGIIFVLSKKSKLTKIGAETTSFCQRYKFYIQKAEQYKLDFSNNPDEGVQYYLKVLPFATSFGFLPQFQKYLQNLWPNNTELSSSYLLSSSFDSVVFYTPPSSSSSSGGGGGGFSGGGGSW